MKKLLTIATAAGMLAFIACGPSAADKEKAAKMKADSARMADSVNQAKSAMMMKAHADSMMMKAKADSMKMADSVKAAGDKGGKK